MSESHVASRAPTRHIPRDRLASFQAFALGDIHGKAAVQETDAAEREVFDRGYQAGHAAGLTAGRAEADQRALTWRNGEGERWRLELQGLTEAYRARLEGLEQGLADEVLESSFTLAQAVLGDAIERRPDALLPVLRDALAELTRSASEIEVRLHPQDADALGDELAQLAGQAAVHTRVDPSIERGGCVLTAGGTRIDARLPRRWADLRARFGLGEEAQELAP